MQADVLLVGQSLHLLFRELAGDLFAFCRETSGAFPQSRQLCGVPDHLGFGVGLGLFCLSAGCLVLGHGGLLVRNFGFDVAGRLLVLGGGFRQAFQFQPGADVFGGGVHALALGTRQLGTEVIYLGLAGGQFFFGFGALFFQLFQPGAQLVQLLFAAEHADAAGRGAAGEGAARVDDLAVQRDDAVAVAEVPRHGGGLGQVLDHDDAAQ